MKNHWYLAHGMIGYSQVTAYIGLEDKNITKKIIDKDVKNALSDVAGQSCNIVVSLSYLGYMTKDEFLS